MGIILQPGYLYWDGTKYVLNNAQGPAGTAGPPGPAGTSFVVGGDLSGTSGAQTVVGLQSHAVASTAPVASAVPVYNTGLSNYDIRKLTLDDLGPAFAITSFTGGSTVEIGASVVNPSFTITYASPASSAHITNTDNIGSPLTLTVPYTSGTVVGTFHHTTQVSVVFTLTAVAATTKTSTASIAFLPSMFGGTGAAGATSTVLTHAGNTAQLSTGDILANEGLSANPVGAVYTLTPSGSQKLYLLLTGSSHTFKDNSTGFGFPFNSPTAVSFTNQNGAVVNMYLYESTNTVSATFNILVVS